MSGLVHAESFRDLVVYQRIREFSRSVFVITKGFPREEMYSLIDQIRRSVRSVGAQIAEAWAKRRYGKHFVSKLTDADGEQQETQHWVEEAFDCGYINAATKQELLGNLSEVGRMLQSMIDKSHLFCGSPANLVREDTVEYFTNTDD